MKTCEKCKMLKLSLAVWKQTASRFRVERNALSRRLTKKCNFCKLMRKHFGTWLAFLSDDMAIKKIKEWKAKADKFDMLNKRGAKK